MEKENLMVKIKMTILDFSRIRTGVFAKNPSEDIRRWNERHPLSCQNLLLGDPVPPKDLLKGEMS
jgi:hypothetical protein